MSLISEDVVSAKPFGEVDKSTEDYDPLNGEWDTGGYRATLRNGSDIYQPTTPVSVALQNLTKLGELVGGESIPAICDIDTKEVVRAILYSSNGKDMASLVKYFVMQIRIDGNKIDGNSYDTVYADNLKLVAELFAHSLRATYYKFLK